MKTKINKSEVLKNAWKILRKSNNSLSWSDCLKQAWKFAKDNTYDFDTLYNKYYYDVHTFCKFKTNEFIADELTNDTFMKAKTNLISFDPSKSQIKTWLINIAKNLVIDYFRTEKKHNQLNHISDYTDETGKEYFTIVSGSTADNSENEYINNEVNRAIDNIKNDTHKEIIKLSMIEGFKNEEIAELLNVSHSLVRTTISRVKEKLQDELMHLVA